MSRSKFSVRARAAATAAVVSGAALVPLCANASAARRHATSYVSDPASLVNPYIGTGNGGDTFPGADMPFGMIQWSPDTTSRPEGGGYAYADSQVLGYSLNHLSGPGCSAEGDVPILPTTGAVGTDPTDTMLPLDHSDETATPGYYQMGSDGIDTQLATTTRAGIGTFTFPSSSSSDDLLLKLSDSSTPDSATHFQVVNAHEVEGYVTTGDFCGASNQYTLHFVMRFDQAISGYGTWTNGSGAQAGVRQLTTHLSTAQQRQARAAAKAAGDQSLQSKGLPGSRRSANGRLRAAPPTARSRVMDAPVLGADGAYVSFSDPTAGKVTARVGISYVSTDNAAQNLAKEIPASDTLTTVQTAAHDAWNAALSKVQVGGGSTTQQKVFYTALYHSLLHPNVNSDDNGQYMGFDGQVHTVPAGHAEYANYSGWDIYRSQTQLEAMLFPKVASDTVSSMLDDYDQTGMLPKWNENDGESYVMVGDPSDSIIADAYAFGAHGFDAQTALSDMETEANVPGNIRPGLSYYENDGYLPIDGTYGCCNYYGPVSTQEEYNAADNSISELAGDLGDTSDQGTFAQRVNNWQNVYNPGSGFLQPKLMDGSFQSGFDPTSSTGFVEADAYVYRGELPFDVGGLIKAEGGDANYIKVLDGLFTSVTNMGATQAQMGNEPSFDLPWEYDWAGAPYKAEQVVREVQDQLYLNSPVGLAGNDDLGAMSSWYVFSALGFYPETPGSATVALGSPEFSSIAIHLGNGRTLTESAPQAADNAPYVHGMTVNGAAWNRAYLPASTFANGGTVDWTLATTPDTSWASAAASAPPSNETGLDPALGDVSASGGTGGLQVVQPGAQTTLTLGVQSLSSTAQTVNWTATTSSGSGITTGPSSGSLIVGAEGQSSVPVSVNVPASTTDGDYQVVFHLTSQTGTKLPDVVEDIGVASPGDLTPYFNNIGVSSDSATTSADFDGDGYSFSEQALETAGVTPGAAVTSAGNQYVFPSAVGTPDNVEAGGQTITVLPVTGATTLGLLGSATNGPSTGTVTIHYTDGTSQTASITFGDWTLNATAGEKPPASDSVVADTPYRNAQGSAPQQIATYMFATSVALQAGKTVQSVTLPATTDQGELHVFALGTDKGPLTK